VHKWADTVRTSQRARAPDPKALKKVAGAGNLPPETPATLGESLEVPYLQPVF